MAVLALSVVLALAGEPRCGARPGIEPARIAAVAATESALDPLAIGANADPARGLPHQAFSPATPAAAMEKAAALLAEGRSVDLGLTGINATNLARDGLTLATAFDPCASIRAAYHHLAGDFEAAAIWTRAHSRYNSGSLDRGASYAASIEQTLARVRTVAPATLPMTAPLSSSAPPPCAPAWDGWALAECSARQAAPTPVAASSAAEVVTVTVGTLQNDPEQ